MGPVMKIRIRECRRDIRGVVNTYQSSQVTEVTNLNGTCDHCAIRQTVNRQPVIDEGVIGDEWFIVTLLPYDGSD